MARKAFISLHPNRIRNFDILKNPYFLYDEVVVTDVDIFLKAHSSGPYARPKVAERLNYLLDKNILKSVPTITLEELNEQAEKSEVFSELYIETDKVYEERERFYHKLLKANKKGLLKGEPEEYLRLNFEFEKIKEKLFAEYYSIKTGDAYSPILENSYSTGVLNQSSVVELIIAKFPVVELSEDWDKLAEFRSDDSTRIKYLRFREFTKKLASKNLTAIEVEEEIEYLVEEYKNHMSLANLKYNEGVIKGIFLTSLKFTENLIKLKLSSAFESLYSIKEKKVELLEARNSAPGKEISLLVDI